MHPDNSHPSAPCNHLHTEDDWLLHLTPFQILSSNQALYSKLGPLITKVLKNPSPQIACTPPNQLITWLQKSQQKSAWQTDRQTEHNMLLYPWFPCSSVCINPSDPVAPLSHSGSQCGTLVDNPFARCANLASCAWDVFRKNIQRETNCKIKTTWLCEFWGYVPRKMEFLMIFVFQFVLIESRFVSAKNRMSSEIEWLPFVTYFMDLWILVVE